MWLKLNMHIDSRNFELLSACVLKYVYILLNSRNEIYTKISFICFSEYMLLSALEVYLQLVNCIFLFN